MIWSYTEQCKLPLVLEVLFHLIIYLKKTTTNYKGLFLQPFPHLLSLPQRKTGARVWLPAWEKACHLLSDVLLPTWKEKLVSVPTSPLLSMTWGRTGSVCGISWIHLQITFWGDEVRGGQLTNRSTDGPSLASWRGVRSSPRIFVSSQILLFWTREPTSLISNPWSMQRAGSLRTINLHQGLAKQRGKAYSPFSHIRNKVLLNW